ncbi:unnamed protein product, partial [Anisakis simplex]|uniref:FLYWCH-type domain-containing protein n=1 Tax=Anisakis simplex TaxID=6269 RepID=A0A0M3J9K0_ANISI
MRWRCRRRDWRWDFVIILSYLSLFCHICHYFVIFVICHQAFSKQFDVTQILRENPDVLNVLANFPFLFNNFNSSEKMTAEEAAERSAKSSPDINFRLCFVNFSSCHDTQSDDWFVCFKGPSVLATALAASLNVISRGLNEDGYEYYDCLNRLRFKCSYRVRMRRYGESFVCEEFGVHRHKADTQVPLSSTGLPRSMREIVDESFRC